jgi:hypothetical protein
MGFTLTTYESPLPAMGAGSRADGVQLYRCVLERGLVQLHEVQLDTLGDLAGQRHAGQDVGREELRRRDLAGVERLVLRGVLPQILVVYLVDI